MPKILQHTVLQRSSLQEPQLAEQLVEVPTIVSVSSLRALVEQNVDTPVPHGRVGVRGLQGLRPGQDSTAFGGSDPVDIPVPRRGGLQGSRHGQGSTAPSSQSRDTADEASTVFSHFSPKQEKCEVGSARGVGTECGLYSVHAASSAAVHVTSHGQGDLGEW